MRPIILLLAFCMISLTSCATRVVTTPATQVTVVKKAPRHYKIVRAKGKRYYFWNGNHYRKTRRGYILVRI